MDDHELKRRLAGLRAPGEEEARRRSWEVVRRAARQIERGPPGAALARGRKLLIGIASLAVAVGLALSPAGAKVVELIDSDGTGEPADTLDRIPGGGRILVSTETDGIWVVRSDGSKRRLGDYDDASFSAPLAVNVAVAKRRQLAAVDAESGEVRWTVTAPRRPGALEWSPDGFRVAYRSGQQLRVVNGDGTGDRAVARPMIGGPAWRLPGPKTAPQPPALAYPANEGRVIAIEPDSGRELWTSHGRAGANAIAWPRPDRVFIARSGVIDVVDGEGRSLTSFRPPGEGHINDMDAAPDGRRIAFIRSRRDSTELWLARFTAAGELRHRRVLTAPNSLAFSSVDFSPDGDRLLVGWAGLDQWLFIDPDPSRKQLRRLVSFGDISEQFAPGARAADALGVVEVEGWAPELPDR